MRVSLVLMDSLSGGVHGLWSEGGTVLSPEGVLVTASLVLIFGGSDLTRGDSPASVETSWTTVSPVLTWYSSDPVGGTGCISERGAWTVDSLVLIRACRILSPEGGSALPLSVGSAPAPPSLAETASRVLIRGRSRGVGSWGEGGSVEGCGSDGDSGRGGSVGGS